MGSAGKSRRRLDFGRKLSRSRIGCAGRSMDAQAEAEAEAGRGATVGSSLCSDGSARAEG